MEKEHFLAKWLNNELSQEELELFKADPDYEIYEKIRNYSKNLSVQDFDENQILTNILNAKKLDQKKINLFTNFYKMAAIFIAIFTLTFIAANLLSSKKVVTDQLTSKTFLLPDYSKVILNNNSIAHYNNFRWLFNRKIHLEGIAYFHVSKGKKFTVSTDLGNVTVLGTKFEVQAAENNFNVVCFEGKVKVNYKNKEVFLTKGMRVKFENGIEKDSYANAENPYEQVISLDFKDEKLSTILSQLEKVYHLKMVSKSNSQELFTGKLPNDNLEMALSIISKTYHLEYRKSAGKILFIDKK
ncbi:FecR family protein [Kaistella sp. G5-32]|uniref:FecR family protein n=1 Tax=Kaistella gelatinilytica TaxID=2787636 RepID=A0ABS0F9V5_9FLAO|nr:FecR family protein [Kaistella gelatinilytica]MBF8456492.1 FecR family protein [Kaistella gelatinilytica]